jgi:hypothetical protein
MGQKKAQDMYFWTLDEFELVNVLTINERLGHEKVDTTWNTYSHLYPNKQLEVLKRLEFKDPS